MKKAAMIAMAAVTAFVALGFDSAPARACGTSIREVVDDSAMRVSRAEKQLGQGHVVAAAFDVQEVFPGLKLYPVGTGPLADRSLRILAVATVRADGALTAGAMRKKDKTQNLAWAVKTLRALDAKRPNNPAIETDLGEAMSKVPEHADEATALLTRLADKDLLASPEGYAALARLRDAAGDTAGRDEATKRCTAMAGDADACSIPDGSQS